MSYRELLLTQAEPLEPHEISDLEDWLSVLEGDVAMFGDTPEDNARMAKIKARIKQEKERP
jgi:hypothetical protein